MTGANIVQAERRKKEFTHFYPEAQPIFKAQLKISASREEKKGVYSFLSRGAAYIQLPLPFGRTGRTE